MSVAQKSARCPTCGQELDPLRAPRVRLSGRTQLFFCSSAHADAFSFPDDNVPLSQEEPLSRGLSERPDAGALVEPVVRAEPAEAQLLPLAPLEPGTPASAAVIGSGQGPLVVALAANYPALSLPTVVDDQASPLVSAEEGAEPVASSAGRINDRTVPLSGKSGQDLDVHGGWGQIRVWAPAVLTATGAGVAFIEGAEFWPALASALILLIFVVVGRQAVASQRVSERSYLSELRERLRLPGERLGSTASYESQSVQARTELLAAEHLRPGEEVIVREGGIFPADGTIVSGTANVLPFLGAQQSVKLGEGSQVTAGAQVVHGELRMICSKTGSERAFATLVGEGSTPLPERVFGARMTARVANQLAPLLAALFAALIWAQGQSYSHILAIFGSVLGAFTLPLSRQIPAFLARNWLCHVARRGVCFPDEEMVDRAGTATVAVFCARGTVLHGEPEVAEIHAFRDVSDEEVLALAAGAESVVHHPIAAAVLRAAELRNIFADASRSHNTFSGMGVVCVSSVGSALVVGSRELLLRERISIAKAEETLRSLESRGLTALMVARDEHLVGVLALQDSLRAGAKATVQLLLDEGIEPVLLSGDSRATTEAVAHALACEHVRPEVPAPLRAFEVRNLIDAGATVAVIGGSPRDDGALGAAQVPIILEGASTTRGDSPHPHERGIGLVGNQVIPAALALICARRIRTAGHFALGVCYLPTLLGAMMSTSLLGPVYMAPLVAGISGFIALWLCQRWLRTKAF